MFGRRSKFFVVLLASIATIAVWTGSAQGRTGAAAPSASSSCNSPGVTGDTVKVGLLVEASGPQAATFADVEKGVKARLAKLEADGGLPGGRKVEYVFADDAADDSKNLTEAKRLVEEDGVFAVLEVSSHSKGSASYLHAQGVPVVGWAIDPVWGQYDNMFGYRNSYAPDPAKNQTTQTPEVMKKLGAKKIAVLGFDNSASTLAVNNAAAAIKKDGLKVANKVIVPAGSTDFTAVAQKLKDSGADGIDTLMDFTQNSALMQAVIQAGIRNNFKAVVFPFGYDPRVPGAFPSLDGGVVGIDFKPYELNLPAHQEFKKYYAQVNGADAVTSQISMVAWLSTEALIKGLQVAGTCPTRANYIKNLRNVKNYDASGLIQPVSFKDTFGKPVLCLYYVQQEKGAWVPAFGGQLVCGKQI
ncbi:MAG TPA: ABC transporter substrate-binding protein [Acidimicrobiia bacterium]|nr:ABC transporter substrate-binding protein [Acidimicrobiia bacterium]